MATTSSQAVSVDYEGALTRASMAAEGMRHRNQLPDPFYEDLKEVFRLARAELARRIEAAQGPEPILDCPLIVSAVTDYENGRRVLGLRHRFAMAGVHAMTIETTSSEAEVEPGNVVDVTVRAK